MEVLGASINGQFLSGTTAVPGAVHVHLWPILDWLPFLHIQLMHCYFKPVSHSSCLASKTGRQSLVSQWQSGWLLSGY